MAAVVQFAVLIAPLVLAIVCHEVAHGLVARLLGDRTAHGAGRLSLNPLRHVDPIGTVLLPGALALLQLPVFGWARPVPVDASRLRNPRTGMMLVALAGPATNLLLGLAGAVLLGVLAHASDQPGPAMRGAATMLDSFLMINVFLALFNLLPLPPFDGSHIVEGLLPRRASLAYARLRPVGLPLMLAVLVVIPWLNPGASVVLDFVWPPVSWLIARYHDLAGSIAKL